MRIAALESAHDMTPALAGHETALLFSSGQRELRASGARAFISVPAKGGHDADGPFQTAVQAALDQARRAGQRNPIVIGAIPFDLSEPSCLYVPDSYEWRARAPSPGEPAEGGMPQLIGQHSIPDETGFKKAVEHAIANFRLSDVRKAVLSVMRELHFSGAVDVGRLLDSLRAQNKDGYQFRVPLPDGSELIGVSPELLLRKEGGQVVSNPLAGSARRHADLAADQAAADGLLLSAKDQFEHRLVIDEIRRVLAPHCAALTVPEQPSLMSTAALWHLSTRLEGRLKAPQTTALQLACLLHPTPAVCGFPTERAHKLIRFVEPFERGLFTGMVGWCDAAGDGEWVVTIRCGIVQHDMVRLFAGAGIVEASLPEAEWAETQTKLRTMLNACGLAA